MLALARLQEDMQSVLERLHTLEALTASQVRGQHEGNRGLKCSSDKLITNTSALTPALLSEFT